MKGLRFVLFSLVEGDAQPPPSLHVGKAYIAPIARLEPGAGGDWQSLHESGFGGLRATMGSAEPMLALQVSSGGDGNAA